MLFATTALAARIERADCGLLTDSAYAIGQLRPESGVFVRPLAGGVATYSGQGSPLNKLAGLGFQGPVDPEEIEEVERLYASRSAPLQVELSSLADPSVGPLLTARGYRLVGFENVLGRPLPADIAPRADPSGVTVAESDERDFATWLDTVVTGFATSDGHGVPPHETIPRAVLERVMTDMSRTRGFIRYVARRHGQPAGAGCVRIAEGVAQMCGTSTLPAHRRRGVQAALLNRRLADAARAGCDVAVVTTQPGSTSQKNVQRKGFELLYTRAILVLAPPSP